VTALVEAFASFETSAWRLEARDTYSVRVYDDALAAFLAGQSMPPRTDGWAEVVAGARSRGAEIGRVRLIGHPITDYTRFEFALYPDNVAFGEDVRIVDRTWLHGSWAAAPDVWLFDDRQAFLLHYGDDGAFLGVDETDAVAAGELRDAVADYAVPLARYDLASPPTSPVAVASAPLPEAFVM
jgi:hypothetical protein